MDEEDDGDMPDEMWLPFTIEDGDITVYFDDEYDDYDEDGNPVHVVEHRESVLSPYTDFPPAEWATPVIDTYEPDDTYSNATLITVDAIAQVHELADADQDWFMFDADAGLRYAFEFEGDVGHSVKIYPDPPADNPQYPTWMENYDDGREEWTCTTTGTYYFVVEAWYDESGTEINEHPTGFYGISLTTTDPVSYITVSLNGEAAKIYEGPYGLQAAYLETGVEPVADSTFYIFAMEDHVSSVFITFKGQAVDTYDIAWIQGYIDGTDNFSVFYNVSDTEQYGITHSGSVIVTAFGAVGEMVVGTFEAVVSVFVNGEPSETTATVSGSFSVERSADGTAL